MRTAITGFSGAVPRVSDYALPENFAMYATNCKIASGEVRGRHTLSLLKDFLDTTVGYAFRIPDPAGNPAGVPANDIWLKFVSPDAVVIRSPVTNDSFDRYYFHEPGGPVKYNTLARIKAGNTGANAPFLLGVPIPSTTPTVSVSGGVATDNVERTYAYTFVSAYGEEGQPSAPSDLVTGKDDGTWTIGNMSTTVPDAAQRNITKKKIYRTITATTGNAEFYFVAEVDLATTSYADTKNDLDVASVGILLQSTYWTPPPAAMQGIISFPGGIILGWKDDTVYMSVPYRPHAWPDTYNVSVEQPIVGIGVTGNTAVVGTKGPPFAITMSTPEAAALQRIDAPEPCLSRGSIVGAPEGVFYASQNGLMLFGSQGFANASKDMITKEEWLSRFNPTTLRSCRFQMNYIGITKPGTGYVINAENPPMSLIEQTNLSGASNIFNDIWTGEVYLLAAGRVWLWDDALTPPELWRWASKRFFTPYEVNFGACRIATKQSEYKKLAAVPPGTLLAAIDLTGQSNLTGQGYTDTGPPPMLIPELPDYAAFRLFVYCDGKCVFRRDVIDPGTVKLPSGLKSQDWQFGIIGRVPMTKFEFAENAKELAAV